MAIQPDEYAVPSKAGNPNLDDQKPAPRPASLRPAEHPTTGRSHSQKDFDKFSDKVCKQVRVTDLGKMFDKIIASVSNVSCSITHWARLHSDFGYSMQLATTNASSAGRTWSDFYRALLAAPCFLLLFRTNGSSRALQRPSYRYVE